MAKSRRKASRIRKLKERVESVIKVRYFVDVESLPHLVGVQHENTMPLLKTAVIQLVESKSHKLTVDGGTLTLRRQE